MERQNIGVSEHAVYSVAGIVIFGILAFTASQSVMVLHRFELPLLAGQAGIYSRLIAGPELEGECRRLEAIKRVIDGEFERRGSYATIRKDALRKTVERASQRTRQATRLFTCAAFVLLGSGIILWATRWRRRLFNVRENVPLKTGGVEGFLRVAGTYLEPDTVRAVRSSPTPENLAKAFARARETVNIPCSIVGRMFPRDSRERLALMEYGKARVVFDVGKWLTETPGREAAGNDR